jgi:hypothetical protein
MHRWSEPQPILVALGLVALAATVRPAHAFSDGIFGSSGRNGSFCTSCHSGGVVPEVAFEAVDGVELAPGAVATFRFRVTSRDSRQRHAGLGVAASGGTLVVTDSGTHLVGFGTTFDLSHTEPRRNDANDTATFELRWQAPATPGTYTLFGAGNSVDLNRNAGGDNAARTTLALSVVAISTPTPTATASPSATATSPETPTATEEPTLTATETPPFTPTPTVTVAGDCAGDCDGGGDVTVDEIVRGVNIGLGTRPVADCLAFDTTGDGLVTVDEIVAAIRKALLGCGA